MRTEEPQFDYHQYEFNTSLIAKVYIDGFMVGTPNDSLYAYDLNGEIRGITGGKIFTPTGECFFNLMVYSNLTKGDKFKFKYFDAANKKYYNCDKEYIFQADLVEYDIYNPFLLNASVISSIDEEDIIKDPVINIYPNPFEYNLNIDYKLFESSHVRITVFDTFGNAVRILADQRQEPGDYSLKWDSDLPSAGTYFIKLETGLRQKILKAILMRSN